MSPSRELLHIALLQNLLSEGPPDDRNLSMKFLPLGTKAICMKEEGDSSMAARLNFGSSPRCDVLGSPSREGNHVS